jgi:hypothetical protein
MELRNIVRRGPADAASITNAARGLSGERLQNGG